MLQDIAQYANGREIRASQGAVRVSSSASTLDATANRERTETTSRLSLRATVIWQFYEIKRANNTSGVTGVHFLTFAGAIPLTALCAGKRLTVRFEA